MLSDIQALIVALQAKDWFTAFVLLNKIAGEVIAILSKQGQQPHVLKMQAAPAADTIEGLTAQLETCCAASAINWGNLLAILEAVLKIVLPLVGG